MGYTQSQHVITVRVPDAVVGLGDGFYLPAGLYEADLTMTHMTMHRQEHDRVAKVMVTVSEDFLQGIGMPPARGSAISYGIDVTRYVLDGSVRKA